MRTGLVCPSCHATETHGFYRVRGIPAHSALLLPTRAEALALPRGEIELRHCWRCNTVFNAAFDPLLAPTTGRCEERQAYSPHFRAWRRRLVEDLVARHDLRDRTILEIGCGGGDFLALLCEIGGNRGVGFDPVFRQENDLGAARDRVTVHRGLYSEREGDLRAEFVVCKLTLGQIPDTFAFLAMLRRALDDRRDTPVFFLEPDVGVALDEARFQDVCYDRCSSFDAGSLEALFRRAGFGDIEVGSGLDGRYLTLEARPNGPAVAADVAPPPLADDGDGQRLGNRVARFAATAGSARRRWRRRLAAEAAVGRRTVLWGAGSKAVAFLTAVGVHHDGGIAHVVDVNPHKQRHFLAGTGQEIVAPDALVGHPPDLVIVLNPVYDDEIRAQLEARGLRPEVVTA